jgi:tRNA (guanine-N7-)-methyltransferase
LSLQELAPYLLEVPADPKKGQTLFSAPLNWAELFGNDHPVEAEVGFGKGLFLVSSAQARPQVNFLGIEISRKYQLFTATRLAKRGMGNVRLVKGDAREFLRNYVASESFQAIHVYFPDPWWKKRHLKRRVFTAEFVAHCERTLQRRGRLNVVTDVEEYFKLIVDLLDKYTRLRAVAAGELASPPADLDYLTNFERKFRQEGRSIYRRTYEK